MMDNKFLNNILNSFCFYADIPIDKGQIYLPLIETGEEFVIDNLRFADTDLEKSTSLSKLGGAYAYYKYCLMRFSVKMDLGNLKTQSDSEVVNSAKEILEMEIALNQRFLKDKSFLFEMV